MNRSAIAATLLASSALAGCAKYEYVIIEPSEFAGHLTKQERVIEWDPVTYHLVDQNSRIGIRVENPTESALTIKGEESYVVTPDGRSEPMRGGTVAPQTWSAFTVPPLVRTYESSGGMSFGLGVGTWGHHGGGGIGVGYDPFYDDVYLPHDVVAWQWKEGAVRVHLTIEPKDNPAGRVEHEFIVERRKVE